MNEKDVARKIPLAQRLSMDAYTSSYFKEIYKYISILYDNCLIITALIICHLLTQQK